MVEESTLVLAAVFVLVGLVNDVHAAEVVSLPTAAVVDSPWSPAMVTAMFGGLTGLIVAVTAMIVTLRGLTKKTDAVIAKAEEIHASTNSNLAKVQAALDLANEKISGLREQLVANTQAKDAAAAVSAKREAVDAALTKPGT